MTEFNYICIDGNCIYPDTRGRDSTYTRGSETEKGNQAYMTFRAKDGGKSLELQKGGRTSEG